MRDQLSLTHGRHTLKFGGEISLNKDIQQTLLNNYGVFSFTGTKTGNALADYLAGLPVSMNQDAPITAMDNFWAGALFLQDDFRLLPRLTLNLGLRYELQQPPTDPFNRESTFELGVQSQVLKGSQVPTGLLVPGDPGIGRGIVSMKWNHVSPRLGLAWDPSGNGKTSIRAGAGIFYGSVSGNEWNSTSNYNPFAVRQTFPNVGTLSNPYSNQPGGVSPFPFTYDPNNPRFILPASIYGVAPNFVRVALHLPVQLLGAAPGGQRPDRDGRLRGLFRPPPAVCGRLELSLLQQHRHLVEREQPAPDSAGHAFADLLRAVGHAGFV